MRSELYRGKNGGDLYYRKLEFHEAVDMAEAVRKNSSIHHRCASWNESESFTGTKSLNEAIKLAREGWEDGITAIEKYLDELDTEDLFSNAVNRPETYRDVTGAAIDIAGFIQGIPEHMVSLRFQERPTHAIKLIINLGQHAYVERDAMLQKATSIFLVAEVLRSAGYILDITGIENDRPSGYYSSDDRIMYEIPILRPGDYMSSAQLAFMMGHPSFLRRIIFAVNESEPEDIRYNFGFREGSGYGVPEPLKKKDLKKAGVSIEDEGTVTYVIDKDDGFGDVLKEAKKILAGIRKLSDKQFGETEGFVPALELQR